MNARSSNVCEKNVCMTSRCSYSFGHSNDVSSFLSFYFRSLRRLKSTFSTMVRVVCPPVFGTNNEQETNLLDENGCGDEYDEGAFNFFDEYNDWTEFDVNDSPKTHDSFVSIEKLVRTYV